MTTATVPQHMKALAYGNEIRLKRATLKRSVFAGAVSAVDIIASPPEEAERMTVGQLLRAQDHWGAKRARKFLAPLAVSENRQLGQLTQAQREEIIAALELYAERKRLSPEGAALRIRDERPWLTRVA